MSLHKIKYIPQHPLEIQEVFGIPVEINNLMLRSKFKEFKKANGMTYFEISGSDYGRKSRVHYKNQNYRIISYGGHSDWGGRSISAWYPKMIGLIKLDADNKIEEAFISEAKYQKRKFILLLELSTKLESKWQIT